VPLLGLEPCDLWHANARLLRPLGQVQHRSLYFFLYSTSSYRLCINLPTKHKTQAFLRRLSERYWLLDQFLDTTSTLFLNFCICILCFSKDWIPVGNALVRNVVINNSWKTIEKLGDHTLVKGNLFNMTMQVGYPIL
jgi:hypothetical protein